MVSILAAARGRPVGRERIVGLLWSETPSDTARHTLSEALYVLRKELGEDAFVVVGDEVGLDPRVPSDLDGFARALEEERWEEAVKAYGGPFLEGFYVADAPEFERWADEERDRLARGYGRALEELATAAQADGAPMRAAEWWRRLLAHDPFSSRVALRLVRALEQAGERPAALLAAEAHALLLREELGVGPGPELAALMDDLRRAPPPPRPAPVAAPPAEIAADVEPVPAEGSESEAGGAGEDDAVQVQTRTMEPGAPSLPPPDVAVETDSRPTAARARRRIGAKAAVAVGGVLAVLAVLGMAALAAWRGAQAPAAPAYDPRRIAVLYLDDYSPRKDLDYLASGLTEMLIHELAQVQELDVVSRNGVKPYRDGTVPFDTMAAQLRAGSIVEGSVQRSGDSVRVVVQLIDANTHSHLKSNVVVRPLDDLFAVEAAVSEQVSALLRQQLGARIRRREALAETRSGEALELVLRGEQAFADALELRHSQDTVDVQSAVRVLAQADAMLARAERADPRWARPTLARAWVAMREAAWSENPTRAAAYDRAVAHANRVLARAPRNARALEARGTALARRSMHPGADTTLRDAGERDLRAALAAEPRLATAWGALSVLLYTRGELAASEQAVQRALEYDAWLEDADALLSRQFYALLTTGDYAAAARVCERGHRSFPREVGFVQCRLTLLRYDHSRPPDPDLAWRLVAQMDTMEPPAAAAAAGRAYRPLFRRMLAASVSARAGDAERARAELARARVAAASDPAMQTSLAFDEAVVLAQLGDYARARERLNAYLARVPGARPTVARDPLVRPLLTASNRNGP